MQRPTAASRRLFAHEAGRKRCAGEPRRNATRLHGKPAEKPTGTARQEGVRTASPKQAFETRIERRHPACAAIPSRKRSPLAQKSAAKTNGGKRNHSSEQTRGIQKPTSGKPLHIDCVSGTPENWRVRRGSANARLGHAYPWYATYSSHIPASLRTFPQRKPPASAKARGGRRASEQGNPDTHPDKTTPRPMGESPGRKPRTGKGDPKRGL